MLILIPFKNDRGDTKAFSLKISEGFVIFIFTLIFILGFCVGVSAK